MSTTVKEPESKDFTPAPQGLHQAVCVDVYDIWTEKRDEKWGGGLRDLTRLVFEIDEINPENGKPYMVSKQYTASLHEKANLRHDLESWRGRAFTKEELKAFDLENVLGANCQLLVVHNVKESKTYANVQTIAPLAKGTVNKIVKSKDYIRKKDRVPEGQPREPGQDEDDSAPF